MEVRVLHLLKKHKGSRRPASWRKDPITCTKEEAIRELTALRDQIVAASDQRAKFEELARVESDCSSAKNGGDLGMFCRDASFDLKVGSLSDIVDTDSGVHIIYRIA